MQSCIRQFERNLTRARKRQIELEQKLEKTKKN